MRSALRALRERIRQVEAGGHRDTPLRREYNHKLRAYRVLRGGGGLPHTHAPDMILSELPNHYSNKYQSPASVAAAIDDMADAIVTKAAQKAKEAIENAACHNPETKLQSALG